MFTGIIETAGKVESVEKAGNNITRIKISSPLSGELKVDQSVAHDGVCLTVVELDDTSHVVEVISETIARSNFGQAKPGQRMNLERAMVAGARLDGHLVQGHVDAVGTVSSIKDNYYTITFDTEYDPLVVEKGSICINGVSLTITATGEGSLSVALIPYTAEHTNLGQLSEGDRVNLEFDILGKYVQKQMKNRLSE